MSRHVGLSALAAIVPASLLVVGGCTLWPARNSASRGMSSPTIALPQESPQPSTQPSLASTQPAAPSDPRLNDFTPEAYARAIDQYLQRRDKTTPGGNAALMPPAGGPPSEKHPTQPSAAHPPPRNSEEVRWIEPPPKTEAIEIGPPVAPTAGGNPGKVTAVSRPPEENASANTRISLPEAPRLAPPPRQQPPLSTSDQLESRLAQQVRNDPRDLAAQLDFQLLQLLRGQQVPQLDTISDLPAEDREVLSALMDALANFRAGVHDDNLMLSRKIRPLIELADRLRTQASLRVASAALCSRVEAFGKFDPIPADRFLAGYKHSVIVYCELENFTSRLNGRNLWQTDLTHEAALYNDRGQRMLPAEKKEPVTDVSRNRRRDFFVVRQMTLPATLAAGRYHLVVTICDQQAQRVTEASLPIQIVSQR